MSIDWYKTMRQASYKGVPFYVDRDEVITGRRISVHEFAMRDNSFNEDLGRKQPKIAVTAYVEGDNVQAKANAVMAACTARGAGTLVLPLQNPVLAKCLDINVTYNYRKLGICQITMSFVEDFGITGGFFVQANPVRMSQVLASSALKVTAQSFADRYNGLEGAVTDALAITGLAIDTAAAEIGYGAALVYGVLDGVETIPDKFNNVRKSFDGLLKDAKNIAREGQQSSLFRSSRYVKSVEQKDPSAGKRLSDMASKTLEAGVNKIAMFENALVAVDAVSKPSELEEDLNHLSVTRRGTAVLLNAIRINVRQTVAIIAMQACAEAAEQITTRREAIRMRSQLAEMSSEILAEAETPEEVKAISELRGQAAQTITEALTIGVGSFVNDHGRNEENQGLAAEITVEAARQLPSVYWAWRLYRDTDRAEELATRNETPHPSFMPVQFGALAK